MTALADALGKLMEGRDLSDAEAGEAMQEVMDGKANAAQLAALLTSLRMKGETVQEIAAFARTMRSNSVRISPRPDHLVDTAGTGGDGMSTFNISTCAAFAAAGAGARVAKHGNRAASGRSGSADVLEALGVTLTADPKTVEVQLDTIGVSFIFAPSFHPAMRHVAPVRRELGFRTVFNLLGPLTNPANAKRQLLGAYDDDAAKRIAGALRLLGAERALVVSGDIDEISISSETQVYEVSDGKIDEYTVTPEEFGFERSGIEAIRAGSIEESAATLRAVLEGRDGPARSVTLLNAGAAIYASGLANGIKDGIKAAERSIDSGKALGKLQMLREFDGHTR